MDGFLTFIFFAIVGFYLLGILGKLLIKMYLRRVQKQFNGFFQNGSANYQQYTQGYSSQQKHEGDVTVTQKSHSGKKFQKDMGDYVDFEEVK